MIVVFSCTQSTQEDLEKTSPFKNVYGNAQYVGSAQCSQCHVEKHETFMHTGMGLSFDTASLQKSAARFTNNVVFDSLNKLYYQAYFNDDNMFVKEWQQNGRGDTTHQRMEQISYIIGSGQHTNSHFWMNNGYVYQAPLTWYVQAQKWGLPPGYKENNVRFDRKIDVECMSCHNSLPKMSGQATNKFLEIPKGIGCERCHGPGSLHVDEKMRGIVVDVKNQTDYTIVNPKRLPYKLQMDVCQRCHLQGNAVLKEGKNFEDFRPGMPLSDIMQVYLPTFSNDNHGFVMASHAERFQQSQCFIQSNKHALEKYNPEVNFTCINCHNPHISVKATNIANFNAACISCHSKNKAKTLCSESLINRNQIKDNCVQCHMPKTGTEDIPHVTIHDHYIRKPEKTGMPNNKTEGVLTGLKSINGGTEAPISNLLAYLTYSEKFDANPFYMQKADEFASKLSMKELSAINVHYWYNKANYNKVLQMAKTANVSTVKHHFMAYQIAQSCYLEGNYSIALIWYNRALELMPMQLDYLLARAVNYIELTNLNGAENDLKQLILLQNKYDKAYFQLGRVYELQTKNGLAKQMYLQSYKLNPLNVATREKIKQYN